MDNESPQYFNLDFDGEGSEYFGIWIVNIILSLLTLGLYYPWAKVANRKFMWNSTSMKNDRFIFNGTGKQIFRGYVIAYLAIIIFTFSQTYFRVFGLVMYLLMLLITPYVIYGAWRYRISRTSWRGIYFSFNGDMKEFFALFVPHFLLSIITFGIYGPWFRVKIEKYLFSHTYFGQYQFDFEGNGNKLFKINFIGIILTFITFFIYAPWYLRNRFKFTIDNITIHHNHQTSYFRTNLDGGNLFGVLLLNGIIAVFTLGLATPWNIIRRNKLMIESIYVPTAIDLDAIEQRTDDFSDATGDSLLDILDIGIDF